MFLITSAAYVTPALASEFGKIPPCMLPVQNKRLYEHQIKLIPSGEHIVLSLPRSYELTLFDLKRLSTLGVTIVKVPDGFSLGQSVVYVLNVLGRYNDNLHILHGDTLFSELSSHIDICSIAHAEDAYDWDTANQKNHTIYSGYFVFSNQSLLIRKITENNYNFIEGINGYAHEKTLKHIILPDWMDFGLNNSYYRSISKLTTQRVFNSMKVTRYSVRKSSKDKNKMYAEANWILSVPTLMKHYVPALWDKGENDDKGFYEIEYYFLPTLANLFVFGKIKSYVWKEIIDACVQFLNDEAMFTPDNKDLIAIQNDYLYYNKTIKRLQQYSLKSGISLDTPFRINGIDVPSIRDIVNEIEPLISKKDSRFVSLMHGDPCFSNILYDFKSKSIKVIDPRGIDSKGNISIYGDFRYDVAKLAHSIIGLYDYIIGGMFEYSENNDYDMTICFEISDDLKDTQIYFKKQTFGGFNLKELSTYPILIHLFLCYLYTVIIHYVRKLCLQTH